MLLPTRRQKDILEAVRSLLAEGGEAPTLEAIARRAGLTSVSTVHKHLQLLQERGLLRRRRKGRRQSIELLPPALSGAAIEVPITGRIAAGRPIEIVLGERGVALPANLVRGLGTYVLRVSGNSMVDDQLLDGDYVVVEDRTSPRNGEVVVALLDGRQATLKRFRRERGRISLQPANSSVAPLFVRPESIQIRGIVTGVLRRY
jgi:repressor LexA